MSDSVAPMALAIDRPARKVAAELLANDLRRGILATTLSSGEKASLAATLTRLIEAHADEIRLLELCHAVTK